MCKNGNDNIDQKITELIDLAKSHNVNSSLLVLDSALMLSDTPAQVMNLYQQEYFKRAFNAFLCIPLHQLPSNPANLSTLQLLSFNYLKTLLEQNLLSVTMLITLKNIFLSLHQEDKHREQQIKSLINKIEKNYKLAITAHNSAKISSEAQEWLSHINENKYNEKYPYTLIRLLKLIYDFNNLINDNWDYSDLHCLLKAAKILKIDVSKKLSLNSFIDMLSNETDRLPVASDCMKDYTELLQYFGTTNNNETMCNYIPVPLFMVICQLCASRIYHSDISQIVADKLHISKSKAFKCLIKCTLENMNVKLEHEFTLRDAIIVILECLHLKNLIVRDKTEFDTIQFEKNLSEIQHKDILENKSIPNAVNVPKFYKSDWRNVNTLTPRAYNPYCKNHLAGNNSKAIYFLGPDSIYKSEDGVSWESINLLQKGISDIIDMLFIFDDKILCLNGINIYFSDNETQFTKVTLPLSDLQLTNNDRWRVNNVFFTGSKWIIDTAYIISDIETRHIIFFGEDIFNLKYVEYKPTLCNDILVYKNILFMIAPLSIPGAPDTIGLISKNESNSPPTSAPHNIVEVSNNQQNQNQLPCSPKYQSGYLNTTVCLH